MTDSGNDSVLLSEAVSPGEVTSVAGTDRDTRVALHEAAHLTVGRCLGREWGGATIIPSGNFSGRCWGSKFESRFAETETADSILEQFTILKDQDGEARDEVSAKLVAHVRERVTELTAGSEAEILHLGDAWPAMSDRQDEAQLANLVCSSEESVLAFIWACAAEARSILARYRHVVKALARELVERRTLNAEQIDLTIFRAVSKRQAEAEARRRADWTRRVANAALFEEMAGSMTFVVQRPPGQS